MRRPSNDPRRTPDITSKELQTKFTFLFQPPLTCMPKEVIQELQVKQKIVRVTVADNSDLSKGHSVFMGRIKPGFIFTD